MSETIETLTEKLDRMTAINNVMSQHLEREVRGRLARHAANRVLTKVQKAVKRLAKGRPEKRDERGRVTAAWKQDRNQRKRARRVLAASLPS